MADDTPEDGRHSAMTQDDIEPLFRFLCWKIGRRVTLMVSPDASGEAMIFTELRPSELLETLEAALVSTQIDADSRDDPPCDCDSCTRRRELFEGYEVMDLSGRPGHVH